MFHKFALEDLNCLYLYPAPPDHNYDNYDNYDNNFYNIYHNYNHNVFNNSNCKLATSYSEPGNNYYAQAGVYSNGNGNLLSDPIYSVLSIEVCLDICLEFGQSVGFPNGFAYAGIQNYGQVLLDQRIIEILTYQ